MPVLLLKVNTFLFADYLVTKKYLNLDKTMISVIFLTFEFC